MKLLRNIDPDQALELVLAEAHRGKTTHVALMDSLQHVLAETVLADRDYPPFDKAMMDGYAIQMADVGKTVALAGEIAAGQASSLTVEPGTCIAIMTGAACPPGTQAVIEKERVRLEGNRVVLPGDIEIGQHIDRKGKELGKGHPALKEGTEITPLAIAILASVGQRRVPIVEPPRLAVITTGLELVSGDAEPEGNTIRDSNGAMLAAQIRQLGLDAPLLLHALDTPESLALTLKQASQADIIVFSGGVSMGRYDLVPQALSDYGATIVFHRVAQKPGKPLLFAKTDNQLTFGLPGNPLGTYLCFHRYVAVAIRKMMGKPTARSLNRAKLTTDLDIESNRTIFLQGRVNNVNESWRLTPRVKKGSANLFSAIDNRVYVRLPPGNHHLHAETEVTFEWADGQPY
jgi:molybdopterin molybdotransferase